MRNAGHYERVLAVDLLADEMSDGRPLLRERSARRGRPSRSPAR